MGEVESKVRKPLAGCIDIDSLSREELLALLDVYAKNWLAHDGCWFLAIEDDYGHEAAIEMDRRAWEMFAAAEARRLMRAFDIPQGGGLAALETALSLRAYARINRQEIVWRDADTLVFRMVECRVQATRERKHLPSFHCKPVGIAEFTMFAQTIDPRIQVRCLTCPPDPVVDAHCAWEFTLKEDDN